MIGVVAGEMTMFDETATGVAAFEVDDFVLFFVGLVRDWRWVGWVGWVGGGGDREEGGCLLGT